MNDKLFLVEMYTTINNNGPNEKEYSFNDEANESLLLHFLYIL
jgi:hypothetical protein